jgi:hypothetical protein
MDTTRDATNYDIDLNAHCEHWFTKYADIINDSLPGLPPLREINHKIPLIDEHKQYSYRLLHCPKAMYPKLMEKLHNYIDNG